MSTILLTFLGTGNYQPCRYQIGDQTSPEETFFSVALAGMLKPEKCICLQTAASSEKHGSQLAADFDHIGIQLSSMPIPEGKLESELWMIFEALTERVPHGATLHFDITHGFRSLPVLGFIALNYLRSTRNVTIGGLHYGAWEARDPNNLAPAFDLTPFLTLLDWTTAAEQFRNTGSALKLANLLATTQQQLWQSTVPSAKAELPTKLKSLANELTRASQNLLLLRTGSLSESSSRLEAALRSAEADITGHAKPFLEVLSPVREELSRFTDTDLATLRDLIAWLADRGQTAAALTLASEWLTSYAMVMSGTPVHRANHATRKPYSLAITLIETPEMLLEENAIATAARDCVAALTFKLQPTEIDLLQKAAGQIRSARNDLNHAGFNDQPATAVTLTARAIEVGQMLTQLPLP
jgi:CRISPR-associated DxTHG motif protein